MSDSNKKHKHFRLHRKPLFCLASERPTNDVMRVESQCDAAVKEIEKHMSGYPTPNSEQKANLAMKVCDLKIQKDRIVRK